VSQSARCLFGFSLLIKSAEILRWESCASRAPPLPQGDRRVGRGVDNRAVGRLESNWPRGSLRGLNLLLRLTQGLRPGLIYVAPSGLDFGGAVSLRFD
jgi:hypothetical protein